VCTRVSPVRSVWSFRYETYEAYVQARFAELREQYFHSLNYLTFSPIPSFRGKNLSRDKFGKAKDAEARREKPHPLRTSPYRVSAHPRPLNNTGLPLKTGSLFYLVRYLSSVSNQMREELGDVFWERTCISIDLNYIPT
jgi:hypothetical protein